MGPSSHGMFYGGGGCFADGYYPMLHENDYYYYHGGEEQEDEGWEDAAAADGTIDPHASSLASRQVVHLDRVTNINANKAASGVVDGKNEEEVASSPMRVKTPRPSKRVDELVMPTSSSAMSSGTTLSAGYLENESAFTTPQRNVSPADRPIARDVDDVVWEETRRASRCAKMAPDVLFKDGGASTNRDGLEWKAVKAASKAVRDAVHKGDFREIDIFLSDRWNLADLLQMAVNKHAPVVARSVKGGKEENKSGVAPPSSLRSSSSPLTLTELLLDTDDATRSSKEDAILDLKYGGETRASYTFRDLSEAASVAKIVAMHIDVFAQVIAIKCPALWKAYLVDAIYGNRKVLGRDRREMKRKAFRDLISRKKDTATNQQLG